jgi:hypothetical protein
MNSNRKASAVAGWLYVLGFVTGILSVAYAVDFLHGFTGNGFGSLADRQRVPSN